jgi:hypothetical protein
MNNQNELPTIIGAPFEGGFYAGRVQVDGVPYILIVAPKAEGEHNDIAWLESEVRAEGAYSYCDGMKNTVAMAEAGSDLANWARGLTIGGHTDWYIPSQDELEVLYRNLKPTTRKNYLYGRSGMNVSTMPPTYAYTADLPAQTTARAFIEGGEQAFADEWYWSSTQHASNDAYAWFQYFISGGQYGFDKSAELRARAVRRFAI